MRMTMDEACLILNVKRDDPVDVIEQVRTLGIFPTHKYGGWKISYRY
jgi:hypothetical protein